MPIATLTSNLRNAAGMLLLLSIVLWSQTSWQELSADARRLRQNGDYAGAEQSYRAALQQLRHLGNPAPSYATVSHGLAVVLLDQGKYTEACRLLEGALPGFERYGQDTESELVTSRFGLAVCYRRLRRYRDAEPLFLASEKPLERLFGSTHPQFVLYLLELGVLYRETDRYTQAEALLLRAVKSSRETTVMENTFVARCQGELGITSYYLGKYEPAIRSLKSALALLHKERPQSDSARYRLTLGELYYTLNQLSKAEAEWRKALSMLEEIPEVVYLKVNALGKLGTLKLFQSKLAEAEELFRAAEQIINSHSSDPALLRELPGILNSLAELYRERCEYARAEQALQRAKEILLLLHPNHTSLPIILRTLARVRVSQGYFTEAELLYRQALQREKEILGTQHPSYGSNLAEYAALLRRMKRADEAKTIESRARAIARESGVESIRANTVDVRDITEQ